MSYPRAAKYQADPNADNYACGSCQRVQDQREGESCIKCGKPTVTWLQSQRESWEDCLKKWKQWYS
jgi:hypothetical protein